MALVKKEVSNVVAYRGTPSDDTDWDKCDWAFSANHLKIIVKQGSSSYLGVSFNGKDEFTQLPTPEANMNALVYDFPNCGLSRIFLRRTGANIELIANGVK